MDRTLRQTLPAARRGVAPRVSLLFPWVAPEPAAEIRTLMRTLARAFPETPPYSGKHPAPEPHLTVARGTENELHVIAGRLQALLPELAAVRHPVDRVTVAQKGADNRWRVIHELPLKGG